MASAEFVALPAEDKREIAMERDGQDLRAFTGTYGDYLLSKVSKVFPQLRRDTLE